MRGVALLISALLATACDLERPGARSFVPNTGQIISADSLRERVRVCMHVPGHDARWTPTEADLATLDPLLIELIEYRLMEDNLTYEDSSDLKPEQYHREYFGLEQDGWRYVLICGRYAASPTYMLDGGPSQFAALYDTRRRRVDWFEFGYRA